MTRMILATGFAVVALNLAASADAQVSIGIGGPRGGATFTIGGGNGFNGGVTVNRPIGMPNPNSWRRPSRPVHVGPTHITGYNPWTGAIHTHNNQINDTAFDFGREQSRHNGTRRYVNRPIRDAWGNITGYERGYVWNNSLTGQEHGETTIIRPNGSGGSSSTTVVRSANPMAGSGGTSTTNVAFAPRHP